jgi:hypothetical protein
VSWGRIRGRCARRGVVCARGEHGFHRLMHIRDGECEVKPMISVIQESVPRSQHWRGASRGGVKGKRRGERVQCLGLWVSVMIPRAGFKGLGLKVRLKVPGDR